MSETPETRRRSERSRRAILQAALDECRERGFEKASMDAIAKRAGVGKQTIYRWWHSKAAVVIEALDTEAGAASRFPDTGDIVADLRTQMRATAKLMAAEPFAVYRSVIAAAQSDPAAASAIVETIVGPRVRACRERLQAARDAGQLRPDADLDVLVEVLYGPLYYRLLLQTAPVNVRQIDAVLDLVFRALAPAKAVGRRPR